MAKKNEIAKAESASLQPLENIENLIHVIRGKQVMLDVDLARLYGVETKRLNEQVKRNMDRFPEDFMFQLSKDEVDFLRSQIATIENEGNGLRSQIVALDMRGRHVKYMPYAFTENGVAMLSGVLRSPQAISINIQIMRAFTTMRHFIAANAQAFQRLEIIERNQLALNVHLAENDKKFEEVFRRLDEGSAKPTEGILFDGQVFDAYTFINDRIREAKTRIILIDNYPDDSVLKMLDKRKKGVSAKIYSKMLLPQIKIDIAKHNAQYAPIDLVPFDRAHDRFLCIDDTVYHIGASLKDLGKKWFAFSIMNTWTTNELLSKI